MQRARRAISCKQSRLLCYRCRWSSWHSSWRAAGAGNPPRGQQSTGAPNDRRKVRGTKRSEHARIKRLPRKLGMRVHEVSRHLVNLAIETVRFNPSYAKSPSRPHGTAHLTDWRIGATHFTELLPGRRPGRFPERQPLTSANQSLRRPLPARRPSVNQRRSLKVSRNGQVSIKRGH